MSSEGLLERYGPWAIVAGGSEGVGAAFVDRLARAGFRLLLVARKPGPLEAVAAEVRARHGAEVRTLATDLTAPEAAERVLGAVAGCEIGLLVYNAGADNSFDEFLDRPIEVHERMVMLNVLTPMRLVRRLAEEMAGRGRGGIILCSSLAALVGTPRNGVYSAAKAFVGTFAEMLWFELAGRGVDVLCAHLPLVRTPAMERLGMVFDGSIKASEPEDIADECLAAIRNGPVLHAGGSHERAMRLRSLPRDQAVRAMAGSNETLHD
jgi:short-subunit dehydrogenase